MSAVTTPRINRIIRLSNFDLLSTSITQYNMYMCLDTMQLWYDETPSKRQLYYYSSVQTVNDLFNSIVPERGKTYYCWEDNSLWLWMDRWVSIYKDTTFPSAYNHTEDGGIESIYIDDTDPTIQDNNGLLRDGSVVIRDAQRLIKGRIFVTDDNDNLTISSYLGGGIRFLPNGAIGTEGELYIDDNQASFIRSQWNVLNNEIYVDYGEHTSSDKNPYQNEAHRYKVYHQGNLKIEEMILTPKQIYENLKNGQKSGELPSPFEFNVNMLDGKKSTDFAFKTHTHTASQITDFKTVCEANALNVMKTYLTGATTKGANITWNNSTNKFVLSTDSFKLSYTGGVTGSGTVVNNTNTTIALTVDPSKHVHQDLVNRIAALEGGGSGGFDPSDYYTKSDTESLIDSYFTTIPTSGKALLVDSLGNLPGNANTASDLNHDTVFSLIGDITGNVTFGYDQTTLSMTTSAGNIVSSTPVAGKALKLDPDGNLGTTAYKAKELDHNIEVKLLGEIEGSATLDTSKNTFNITTTVSANSGLLKDTDLGVTVAQLGSNGKVLDTQLPDGLLNSLKMMDTWSGGQAPNNNPEDGQVYLVTADCLYGGQDYLTGDWIYYYNSQWNKADITNSIKSVNNKTGNNITLTYSDVKAISDTYIDYTVGTTIPSNKIVITDKNGHIAGATVDNLTDKFEFKTTGGDIGIDTTSINTETDGSKDLDVTFKITNDGYTNITNKVQRTIKVNGTAQPFRKNLNFKGNIDVADNSGIDTLELTFKNEADNILYFDGSKPASSDFLSKLTSKFELKDTEPFYIAFRNNNMIHFIDINEDTTGVVPGGSITVNSNENTVVQSGTKIGVITTKGTITFSATGDACTAFSVSSSKTEYETSAPSYNAAWGNGGATKGIGHAELAITGVPSDKLNNTIINIKLSTGLGFVNEDMIPAWTISKITVNGTNYPVLGLQYVGSNQVFVGGTTLQIYLTTNTEVGCYLVGIPTHPTSLASTLV